MTFFLKVAISHSYLDLQNLTSIFHFVVNRKIHFQFNFSFSKTGTEHTTHTTSVNAKPIMKMEEGNSEASLAWLQRESSSPAFFSAASCRVIRRGVAKYSKIWENSWKAETVCFLLLMRKKCRPL